MEFSSASNANYRFLYFDLTVKNSSGVTQPGRLWSYAWDLNTEAQVNPFNGTFYVYTSDGYVTKVNLNGIQPFGFVVLSNKTGTGVSGNVSNDRQSVSGDSEYPLYKVFVNNPDSTVYPSGSTPTITNAPTVVGGVIYAGQQVKFRVGVSSAGLFQIFISINEHPTVSNVVVSANVTAGIDTITWNGKDSLGNYPPEGSTVTVTTEYSVGVTHLPIWDPETNANGGYIINRIRPVSSSVYVRWDDIGISGTENLSGGSGNSHQWATNFGNNMTMNTWWDGYNVVDSNVFVQTVNSPLPIELVNFTAELSNNNSKVVLNWSSAIQINNAGFSIEKTTDFINFQLVGVVKGAGNSDQLLNYSLIDETPYSGVSYYRLKQTDYNGNSKAFNFVEVNTNENDLNSNIFLIYPNPGNANEIYMLLKNYAEGENFNVNVYDAKGLQILNKNYIVNNSGISVYHLLSGLDIKPGIYFVTGNSNNKSSSIKLIIN